MRHSAVLRSTPQQGSTQDSVEVLRATAGCCVPARIRTASRVIQCARAFTYTCLQHSEIRIHNKMYGYYNIRTHRCMAIMCMQLDHATYTDKNSSVDEIANVNFYAVRPEDTRIR